MSLALSPIESLFFLSQGFYSTLGEKLHRAPFIFKDMENNRCDVFSVGIVIVDTFHLARAFRDDTFACGYFPWRTDGHSG